MKAAFTFRTSYTFNIEILHLSSYIRLTLLHEIQAKNHYYR